MTQLKTCTHCKEAKPISAFSPCNGGGKYGVRSECRVCRLTTQRETRARREARDREIVRLEAAARQAQIEEAQAAAGLTKALPRTFNYVKDPEVWVPVDKSFYRNTGNKHIPSKGLAT